MKLKISLILILAIGFICFLSSNVQAVYIEYNGNTYDLPDPPEYNGSYCVNYWSDSFYLINLPSSNGAYFYKYSSSSNKYCTNPLPMNEYRYKLVNNPNHEWTFSRTYATNVSEYNMPSLNDLCFNSVPIYLGNTGTVWKEAMYVPPSSTPPSLEGYTGSGNYLETGEFNYFVIDSRYL